jgi:hypothetical protein
VTAEATGDRALSTATTGDEGLDAAVTAARRVISSLLRAGEGTAAPMTDVAARLHAVADDLDAHTAEGAAQPPARKQIPRYDPVTGPGNAIAPPLSLAGKPDGSVEGTTALGLAYQGPPGHVHGGITALLLDHTLGVANGWNGHPGMTAELTLRYHRPTPLSTPLTVTGRTSSVDGRKIRATGEITAGGQRCVSAEGLFIGMPPSG